MIGLPGAHRVGKTTLAKAFAAESDIPFAQTSTSEVMAKFGFDPQKDYDLTTRLYIQNRILDAAVEVYKASGHTFITDRTPLDMLAYMMADIQRENTDEITEEAFANYVERCFSVTNQYFTTLIVVQPGIELVEDRTKAPCKAAYIEHINSLIIGLVTDERNQTTKHFIRRDKLDLKVRMTAVFDVVHRVCTRNALMMQDVVHH